MFGLRFLKTQIFMTIHLNDSQKELTRKAILSEINFHQQKINSWVELYRQLQSEQTDINPHVSGSLPEHRCQYCGVMTTEPDEQCYQAPSGNDR